MHGPIPRMSQKSQETPSICLLQDPKDMSAAPGDTGSLEDLSLELCQQFCQLRTIPAAQNFTHRQ